MVTFTTNGQTLSGNVVETLENGDKMIEVTSDNWELVTSEPGGIITLPASFLEESPEPERPAPSQQPKPGKPPKTKETQNTVPVGGKQPDIIAKMLLISIGAAILYNY